MTSPRRKLLLFPAMGLAAALAWQLVGGITTASGQEKPIVIRRAHAGSFRPSFTKPIFILALGTDNASPRYGRGGRVERGRTDSIHIIAINPVKKKATIVGIPRDSDVQLACGGKGKINAAQVFGGTDCIIKTVENLSAGRIRFDYYLLGSFTNLETMVNDLGGVPVNVEPGIGSSRRVLQDTSSKARGTRVGRQTLDGFHALAYSRNRHDYGRGDFDRTRHQGQVIIGGLTKARELAAKDPGKTLLFLRSIIRNTKNDIPLVEAFRLGLLALQIKPSDVTNTFLDGTDSVILFDPRPLLNNVADDAIIN
jgi:polyisoprenyl-teichoic acid--peptidoglycan teichoic acid transferase